MPNQTLPVAMPQPATSPDATEICNIFALTEDSLVRSTSVQDIRRLSGQPFTSRSLTFKQGPCPSEKIGT